MSSKFRSHVSVPLYTLTQIVALQAAFYAVAGVGLWVFDNLAGLRKMPVLRELFDAGLMTTGTVHDAQVWCVAGSFLVAGAGLGGFLLMFFVGRAKLCIDFALTLYAIHLVCCSFYAGFPSAFLWWTTHGVSAIVMILAGEYLCMRRELEPIKLSFTGAMERGDTIELDRIHP
jgi:hypothetical protein